MGLIGYLNHLLNFSSYYLLELMASLLNHEEVPLDMLQI